MKAEEIIGERRKKGIDEHGKRTGGRGGRRTRKRGEKEVVGKKAAWVSVVWVESTRLARVLRLVCAEAPLTLCRLDGENQP